MTGSNVTPLRLVGEQGGDAKFDDVTDQEPPGVGGGGEGGEQKKKLPPCPVEALGQLDGHYWFRSPLKGERHRLSESKLFSRAGIARLFDGNTEWLRLRFPRYGKLPTDEHGNPTGDPAPVIGWLYNEAAEFLMRACADKPLWDPLAPQRERGVWVVGESNDSKTELLVHCGDAIAIIVNGKVTWDRPGFRRGGIIYYAAAPMRRPDLEKPATLEEANELIEGVNLWACEEPNAGILMAGSVALAQLGQAVPHRSHIIVVAPPGSGKSELARLCVNASCTAVYYSNFSEASLRHSISNAARAIELDEAEGDRNESGFGAVELAIQFLRRLSTGKSAGSRVGRDGQVETFNATASARLYAVSPPVLQPADATRFTRVDILPLEAGADDAPVTKAQERMTELAPKIWGRMILGRGRFLQNLAALTKVMGEEGCAPRQIKQVGSLLAAYSVLERDTPIDEKRARLLVGMVRFAIQTVDDLKQDNGGTRCLNHLWGSASDSFVHGVRRTVGQVVAGGFKRSGHGDTDRSLLPSMGMRFAYGKSAKIEGLWILNTGNAFLTKVFAGTPDWSGSRWGGQLKLVPGAMASKDPMRIGGAKERATFIPLVQLPPEDEDELEPPVPPEGGGQGPP